MTFAYAMITLAMPLTLFLFGWIVSLVKRDASVADWFWGLGFVLMVFAGFFGAGAASPVAPLMLLLVAAWGVRLGVHLISRHAAMGVEDARYATLRRQAGPNFAVTSLFTIFLVQAVVAWLVATPIHVVLTTTAAPLWPVVLLGVAVFAVGFAIEWKADVELDRFRRDKANQGRLLTTGLFAYVRHPNYLGELIIWAGFGVIAAGAAPNLIGIGFAFAGPALLALVILKASGVPPKEAQLAEKPGYAAWAARTPALVPRRRAAEVLPDTPAGTP